jgi:hypothetical protein
MSYRKETVQKCLFAHQTAHHLPMAFTKSKWCFLAMTAEKQCRFYAAVGSKNSILEGLHRVVFSTPYPLLDTIMSTFYFISL